MCTLKLRRPSVLYIHLRQSRQQLFYRCPTGHSFRAVGLQYQGQRKWFYVLLFLSISVEETQFYYSDRSDKMLLQLILLLSDREVESSCQCNGESVRMIVLEEGKGEGLLTSGQVETLAGIQTVCYWFTSKYKLYRCHNVKGRKC